MYAFHRRETDGILRELDRRLEDAGADPARALESGQLTFVPAREFYLRSGHFEPERQIEELKAFGRSARREGYPSFRLIGESDWVAEERPRVWRGFLDYERRANRALRDSGGRALCIYSGRRFDRDFLGSAARAHERIYVGSSPGGEAERDPAGPGLDVLTPRQREILTLIARSHTSREIGEILGISPKTVETHRANLMARLRIHDLAGLVRFAIAEGLVEPGA